MNDSTKVAVSVGVVGSATLETTLHLAAEPAAQEGISNADVRIVPLSTSVIGPGASIQLSS